MLQNMSFLALFYLRKEGLNTLGRNILHRGRVAMLQTSFLENFVISRYEHGLLELPSGS